mmetsp:Transcript_86512/g.242243  ORF Transcript_86512/g.242243 Transcript_86512/m.242243 type:complete len:85 (+) Transcript_86512:53-307(+)
MPPTAYFEFRTLLVAPSNIRATPTSVEDLENCLKHRFMQKLAQRCTRAKNHRATAQPWRVVRTGAASVDVVNAPVLLTGKFTGS